MAVITATLEARPHSSITHRPEEDLVIHLEDGMGLCFCHGRHLLGIWDGLALPGRVKPPPVERAGDAVSLDRPTSRQVGAQMWAVGVEDCHLPAFRAEDGKLLAQGCHLLDALQQPMTVTSRDATGRRWPLPCKFKICKAMLRTTTRD